MPVAGKYYREFWLQIVCKSVIAALYVDMNLFETKGLKPFYLENVTLE